MKTDKNRAILIAVACVVAASLWFAGVLIGAHDGTSFFPAWHKASAGNNETHYKVLQWPAWCECANVVPNTCIAYYMHTQEVAYGFIVRCDHRDDLMFTNFTDWNVANTNRLPASTNLEFCLLPRGKVSEADLTTTIVPKRYP